MRRPVGEQLGVLARNDLGFDLEDAKPIDAAVCAAAPALQSIAMKLRDRQRRLVNEDMQTTKARVHTMER